MAAPAVNKPTTSNSGVSAAPTMRNAHVPTSPVARKPQTRIVGAAASYANPAASVETAMPAGYAAESAAPALKLKWKRGEVEMYSGTKPEISTCSAQYWYKRLVATYYWCSSPRVLTNIETE